MQDLHKENFKTLLKGTKVDFEQMGCNLFFYKMTQHHNHVNSP